MKKLYIYTLILTLLVTAAASIASSPRVIGDDKAAVVDIGQVVPDFKLPDPTGKSQSLASVKGKNGTVFIFISVRCPVSNRYNERMQKLSQEFSARGINVVGINSNATETSKEMKEHAAQNNMTFMILKDKGNKIADMFGAERTPEAFLLDANNKLVYRGRIDNHQSVEMVTTSELREAIEAILAGRAVTKTRVNAFGCTIKRA